MTAMSSKTSRSLPWPVLAAGDALALVAFILVGLSRHHAFSTYLFMRNAVPVLGAWFALSPFLKTYRKPGLRSLLLTWAIAVPIAVAARSLYLGQPTGGRFFVFLGVSLLMTGLFVGAWRLIAAGVSYRLRRNASNGPVPVVPSGSR